MFGARMLWLDVTMNADLWMTRYKALAGKDSSSYDSHAEDDLQCLADGEAAARCGSGLPSMP
jgi:hypothetical protein